MYVSKWTYWQPFIESMYIATPPPPPPTSTPPTRFYTAEQVIITTLSLSSPFQMPGSQAVDVAYTREYDDFD
jgi:hypothetical protein